MVNKFITFALPALMAGSFVAWQAQPVLAEKVAAANQAAAPAVARQAVTQALVPAATRSSGQNSLSVTSSGDAAFRQKGDKITPRLGEGVSMRDKKTQQPSVTSHIETPAQDVITRSQKFVYHFDRVENPSGETIVLLHGSGGDEASLVPFARQVWPRATLLGIRGRVLQEGRTRWYARISPVKFDQKDVRVEADAFVTFLSRLAQNDAIDLSRTTFVGYSNGANLLAATMLLHPDLVKKAVLMRSMPVLDQTPDSNLSKAKVLTISGRDDKLYAPFAPALSALLRSSGAKVDARIVPAGHMIGDKDVALVEDWLAGQGPDGAPAVSMQSKTSQ